MNVPLFTLNRQHEELMDELMKATEEVIKSGKFILGPWVAGFEEKVAEYLGVKYAVGVGNGTDAISIALSAIDVKPGDEIITTPFTFIATAETIAMLGARPVFVDIDPDTFNINPDLIEEKITEKTKAIIPVHLYGQAAEMDKIMEIAEKHGLYVIEDTAQGIGATYKGKKLGTIGHIGTFSFFPTKNLGALGDGGLVVTNDEEIYKKAKSLRVHGSPRKYYHEYLGYNSRLDSLQAAYLLVKLPHTDRWNQMRRKNAEFYNENLRDVVKVPVERKGNYHIYHQYSLRTDKRDKLKNYLVDNGIGVAIHYPIPLHLQPAFFYLGYKEGDFPEAEKAAKEVLSLPIFPELTDEEKEYVVKKIWEFFGK